MSRPLVVTDCDEVLLHMVRHFCAWLSEAHGIEMVLDGDPFAQALIPPGCTEPLLPDDKWRYLDLFFDTEMDRQTAIDGAVPAIVELQRAADVVILTNLADRYNAVRSRQLAAHGISARVFTNQGPKGPALQRIVAEYSTERVVFVDDLLHHHASAAGSIPDIARLHFCGEPAIAPHIPCALEAGHAHARIDTWAEALPWLVETLHGERR